MGSDYLTDEEYRTYWVRLDGLRKRVSDSLELSQGMKILDVGTGYGLFALEMAKQLEKGTIIGIDIIDEDTRAAWKLARRAEVADLVSIVKMDAIKLSFPNGCFDLATSFLGMRDIYMTRGKKGVKKAVEEMTRVVKPNGRIVLCLTPPEDMETEDQKIAVKLEGEIFGAKSLPKKFYLQIFRENNVALRETEVYLTHKKMTASQTKIEFKDGIEIQKKVYRRKVLTFREIWDRYGKKIEAVGYGMYSKIITLVGQKVSEKSFC